MIKKLLGTIVAALAAALGGYAQGALAAYITPIEVMQRVLRKGAEILVVKSATNAYAGLTTLASGQFSVTISTAIVASGNLINATFAVQTLAPASGQVSAMGVSSIVNGVSFAYGYLDGQTRGPGGTVMWEIRRTK